MSANMSVDQADIVSRHLGAGHAYLRAGDAVAAAAEFQQVLAFRPHHIGALGGLAASCNRRGMVDDAITALRAALTIAPQVTNFHVQLGHLLIRKANGEDAQTAFLAALALEPKNAAARGGLEKALTAPGAPAGPGLVEAALEAARLKVTQSVQLGHRLHRQGDHKGAEAAFAAALALNPALAPAWIGLANALNQQGNTEAAVAALRHAAQIAPEDAGLHVQLGTLLNRLRRHEAATASFRAALALDANHAGALAGLAGILNQQGKIDEAISAIRAAIAQAPNAAGLHVQLGQMLEEQHALEAAAAAYRQAARLDPSHPPAAAGLRRVRDPADIFRDIAHLLQSPDDGPSLERLSAALEIPPNDLQTLIGFVLNPQGASIPGAASPFDRAILRNIAAARQRQDDVADHRDTVSPSRLREAPPETDPLGQPASHETWTPAQWLNAYILRQTKPLHQLAAVVSMRDEGLSILEWIAHYRVLGVATIFVYANDNVDGSDDLLRRLAGESIITLIENRMGGDPGCDPQMKAFGHALHLLPELWAHEWVLFADSDEFLLPHPSYGGRIGALIDDVVHRFPDRAPSAICFNWLWYVSGETYAYEPKPLLRRFRHAVPRGGMKSMVRLHDIFSMHRIHFPEMAPGGFLIKSGFTRLEKALRWKKEAPIFASGQLNHYWSKSFEEFAIKLRRGNATGLPIRQRRFEHFFSNNAAETAENFAPPPESHVLAVEAEMARLMALPGITACVANIHARLPELLGSFNNEGGLRAIFERMRAETMPHDMASNRSDHPRQ